MKQRDIPQGENMTDAALAQWAQAFGFIATRYRVACSPGALIAGAPWLKGKPMVPALTQLAREAGLSFQLLTADQQSINSWRLPVVVALNDGRVGAIEHFDGDDTLEVSFFDDQTYTNRLSMTAMLPAIRHVIASPCRAEGQPRGCLYLKISPGLALPAGDAQSPPLQLGDARRAVYQRAVAFRDRLFHAGL